MNEYKIRRELSSVPNLFFASSEPGENEEVWSWPKLIGFYTFLLFIDFMLTAVS